MQAIIPVRTEEFAVDGERNNPISVCEESSYMYVCGQSLMLAMRPETFVFVVSIASRLAAIFAIAW